MKNIAIIIPNLQSGGSERIVSRISRLLNDHYKVFVIVFDSSNQSYEIGGKLIDLNLKPAKGYLRKAITFLKRVLKLKRIINKYKIEIAFSFTSNANNVLAFSFAKCRKIVSCRGFGYLQKHYGWYKKLISLNCEILFNSKEMHNFYLKKYPQDANKVHVIYNVFDLENIRKLSTSKISEEENHFFETHKVIITVSHFSPSKGQWHLIKSFDVLKSEIPDAGLVFVGNRGELEDKIKAMASTSRYSQDILFLGFQDNPFKYLAKADVYALSSINEGFPNSLVEAMICGAPVVTTNCQSGPAEILLQNYQEPIYCEDPYYGDYGIITPKFDEDVDFDLNNKNEKHFKYAKALSLLINDANLNAKYRILSTERSKQYNEKDILNKYIELIEKV